MKKIKLLAPAGSLEILRTAIHAGADAVYFGGDSFSARASATNFSYEEMQEGIAYARFFNRQTLIAVNTLVKDEEIDELLDYAEQLAELAPDGIIVQDLGVAKIFRECIPQLPVHASTQLTTSNRYGVQALKEMGFKRIVLSRELTLDEIEQIAQHHPGVELEAFIHGAQCFSYSGQCLMSSMIGGRSGNRGLCAQPCRLPYQLDGRSGTLLSPKDMMGLPFIRRMVEIGIDTLKIEGRLKNRDYVFQTVSNYRQMIDRVYEELDGTSGNKRLDMPEITDTLSQTFNRSFSTGYLAGDLGKDLIGLERHNNKGICIGTVENYRSADRMAMIHLQKPLSIGDGIYLEGDGQEGNGFTVSEMFRQGESVTDAEAGDYIQVYCRKFVNRGSRVYKSFDKKLSREIVSLDQPLRIGMEFHLIAECGQHVVLHYQDADGNSGSATHDFIVEKAHKHPLTQETVDSQLQRLGNTLFYFMECQLTMEEGIIVPVSVLNELRRLAVEQCMEQRTYKEQYQMHQPDFLFDSDGQSDNIDEQLYDPTVQPYLAAKVSSLDVLRTLSSSYTVVYYSGNWDELPEAVHICQSTGGQTVYAVMSAMIKEQACETAVQAIHKAVESGVDGFVVNQIGQREMVLEAAPQAKIIFDLGMHAFNQHSYQVLQDLGAEAIHLSLELNKWQLEEFLGKGCVYLHSRYRLMITEHSLLSAYSDRHDEDDQHNQPKYLVDRKDYQMPVIENQYGQTELYNSQVTSILVDMPELYLNHHQGFIVDVSRDFRPAADLHHILELYAQAYRLVCSNGQAIEDVNDDKHYLYLELEELQRQVREEYKSNLTKGHWQRGVK